MEVKQRLLFWKDIGLTAWRWAVLTPLAAISFATWARDEFLNAEQREKFLLGGFLPGWQWEWWALAGMGLALLVMLEAAYRRNRKLRQELADKEGPSALPLTVTVDEPPSVIGRKFRFRVCNSTDIPVTEVYGKYRRYRKINQPWYRFGTWRPSDGMDLPWDVPKGGTTTIAKIGAHSSEYLNFGKFSLRSFQHYRPNGKLTHALNGGTYEFDLEIGSKTNGKPIFCRVRVEFLGRFDVKIIPPTPDTEADSPQATLSASPEK